MLYNSILGLNCKSLLLRNLKVNNAITVQDFLAVKALHMTGENLMVSLYTGYELVNQENNLKIARGFSSTLGRHRIYQTFAAKQNITESLSDLYASSIWAEREIFDMYGIFFKSSKDLRKILTNYGFFGYPLRKLFPVIGYRDHTVFSPSSHGMRSFSVERISCSILSNITMEKLQNSIFRPKYALVNKSRFSFGCDINSIHRSLSLPIFGIQIQDCFKYYRNGMHVRTMISSRCIYAVKTAYICLHAISNNDFFNKLSNPSTTKKEFDNAIGTLALDHSLGTPQHKKSILSHMFNHQYNTKNVYALVPSHQHLIVANEPKGPSPHIITEMPLIKILLDNFSEDIKSVIITSDTIPVVFDGQKQPNVDYILEIAAKKFDTIFGFGSNRRDNNIECITRYHDCKDSQGMLRHATRGTIGLITFDPNGKNIQTMPFVVDSSLLKDFIKNRLSSLEIYLNNARILELFENSLEQCKTELESNKSIFDINKNIEHILWHDIQKHPSFPRSISFVFLNQTTFDDESAVGNGSIIKYNAFQQKLLALLNINRNAKDPKDLNKKGDMKEYYRALIKAYQAEVDPAIIEKLNLLNVKGIRLSNSFIEILNHLSRHG